MVRRHRSIIFAASFTSFALLGWLAVSLGQQQNQQTAPAQQQPPTQANAAQPQLAAPAQQQVQPQNRPAARLPAQAGQMRNPRQRVRQGPQQPEHQQAVQECMRECRECARVCNRTSWHGWRQARTNPQFQRVQQLAGDCQGFCDFALRMMERNSPLMADSCRACEFACNECAAACEQAGANDRELAACAKKCRECAAACHRMEEMHGGGHEHAEHH